MSSKAKFITGSIMRHVIVMSLTSSVGLIALFIVDLLDFYFISLLGESSLAAAVGYAGTLLFFITSVSIGLSIAMGALVSKNLGAGKHETAQEYGVYVLLFILIVSVPLSMLMFIFAEFAMSLLGVSGDTLEMAKDYFRIVVLGAPLMSLAMGLSAILRSLGEAKNAMMVLLVASIVNGVLDPIFIFVLGWGLDGAAGATLASRVAMILAALYYIYKNRFFVGVTQVCQLQHLGYLGPIIAIALPAIATNLATPIGNAYVTRVIAEFGDSAVAGMSMIGRLSPVAFAVIFALSGAIGPIIGQNLGAERCDRVRQTVRDSMLFSTLYILGVSLFLLVLRNPIVDLFGLTGDGRDIGILFLTILSWLFIFQAMVFISNAVFNNIGKAKQSTVVNVLKATVFTMPFVYFGAEYFGSLGVFYGQALGSVFIGIIALWWCIQSISKVDSK
ncbi:MATE family efflux transporter [Candidatus Gracilibacteria bacterium]|nr:MATE family efflux transporter [Candidatus Gracilibacteria bacterium]